MIKARVFIIALSLLFTTGAMATQILTVGSGKTYSTIQAAVNAVPSTLTEPYYIDVYAGSYSEVITISGKTTSAANFLELRQVTGNLVVVTQATSGQHTFNISSNYVTIRNFSSLKSNSTDSVDVPHCITSSGTYTKIIGNTFNSTFTSAQGRFCDVALTGSNAYVYNNIFESINGTNSTQGVTCYGTNCLISNNSFYEKADTNSSATDAMIVFLTASPIVIKNNIFYNTSAFTALFICNYDSTSTYTLSNNIYYAPNTANVRWSDPYGTAFTTFATWVSHSSESSSQQTNPGYSSTPFNLKISPSSAAYNAGVDLSSYGYSTDIIGITRPQFSTWDIGAYEAVGIKSWAGGNE